MSPPPDVSRRVVTIANIKITRKGNAGEAGEVGKSARRQKGNRKRKKGTQQRTKRFN